MCNWTRVINWVRTKEINGIKKNSVVLLEGENRKESGRVLKLISPVL